MDFRTFTMNNKRYSEALEKKLLKRKAKFPTVTLKFRKKAVYRNNFLIISQNKAKKHCSSILLIIFLCVSNKRPSTRGRLFEGAFNRGGVY